MTGMAAAPGAPHVRDTLDLRRAMRVVLWAVAPCAGVGVVNTGWQALCAAQRSGLAAPPGWRGALLASLGATTRPDSGLACALLGLAWLLPVLAVAAAAGLAWGELFARVRRRPRSEAIPVVVVLFALLLPPAVPLWQVAIGASLAVVLGLEIFGGTGRNVVNPALVGFALLYFAYPASFSAEGVWVATPGAQAKPVLAAAARGGMEAVRAQGITWSDTLVGLEPGALGETSALACALGGALLVWTGLASWRVMLGAVAGLAATAALANAFGDPDRPLVGLPVAWHLSTGAFAFGVAFLATDPVTSAVTPAGRWAYGAFVGFFTVLVRVFNPAHAEGVVMAVLLGNVLAPLLDHVAVRVRLRRRRRRLA
jgi:Na+-transporting NADH:ubiquinone oxidoreductase subunit B